MRESIFSSAMRAFLVGLFAVMGLCFGLILLIALLAGMGSSATTSLTDPETTFSQKILANANGERKTSASTDTPVILQMNIDGVIGATDLTTETIAKQLMESREGDLKHDRVKGILLHINTPGGTVVDADGIYRAIKTYKEQYKVPVYAYVDGLCASGGMYVACAADKVNASDVSIVGSVGVVTPSFMNFTQLIEKIGVQALTLSAGKDKDLMNPLRPWKAGEEEQIQELINYYYNHFVNIVATNRPLLTKEKLVDVYGARVFNASQAKEYGYVDDGNSNRRETLKELLVAANITDENYQVIELHHKTWLSELLNSKTSILSGKVTHQLDLGPEFDAKLSNQFLYLYKP